MLNRAQALLPAETTRDSLRETAKIPPLSTDLSEPKQMVIISIIKDIHYPPIKN